MAKRLDRAVAVHNVKTPGRHPVGETLYLMVWPSARKSWVQRLTIEGKRKDLGLGPYPAVSLAQARERARDNLSLAKSGGNPLAAKQEEAKLSAVPTFEALARQHIAENLGSWRSAKHGAQWSSTLATYAFPTLGALQVNEITRKHVVDALSPIWTSKPETARRVRQRIRAVMDRAAALGFIDYNPAGDVINAALAKQPRVKNHHRALPYARLPAALCAVRESTANASVKLAFRDAGAHRLPLRRGPGHDLGRGGPRGSDLDGPRGEDEGRPAPPRAPLPRGSRHPGRGAQPERRQWVVFPAPRSGEVLSDMAFTQLLRRLELDFVPHGLRSSFRDWAAEQTDARHDVVESALAHAVGNATEAAYFRSDLLELRRRLMEDWGGFLESGANR